MRNLLSLIAASALIFAAAPAIAAIDAYLKLDGVTGESKTQPGAIELMSFSWGTSEHRSIGSATGGAGAGKADVRELVVTKSTDSASPLLFKAAASGQHFSSATLQLRKAGGETYETYKLSDVLISSFEYGGKGGQKPTESFTLNFAKIEMISTSTSVSATGDWGKATTAPAGGAWSH
jgi:type VI secretion system secreted protein Hcp